MSLFLCVCVCVYRCDVVCLQVLRTMVREFKSVALGLSEQDLTRAR